MVLEKINNDLYNYLKYGLFTVNANINLTSIYNLYYEDLLNANMKNLGIDVSGYHSISITAQSQSVYYSVTPMYGSYNGKEGHYLQFSYEAGTVSSVSAKVAVIYARRDIL